MLQIVPLTEPLLRQHLVRICAIESECVAQSESRYRNTWTADNFTAGLPGKWRYSRLILAGESPAGFYISSEKTTADGTGVLHGHRVAVLREARTPNLLRDVYADMFADAFRGNLSWFTGYQPNYNPAMLQWYVRLLRCRVVVSRDEIEFFSGPIPDGALLEPDGLMRSPNGNGQYLIVRPLP